MTKTDGENEAPLGGFLSLRGVESEPKPPRHLRFAWRAKKKADESSRLEKDDSSVNYKPSSRRFSWNEWKRSTACKSTRTLQKPPECIGTCFHQTWNESKKDPEAISQDVREFCESPRLVEFCEQAGLIGPSFEWSHYMCPRRGLLHFRQNENYTRFWEACQAQPDSHMAVVFHGTSEEAIPRILKHGLDPKYRRTQAFGKGEYFSKEAGLATTYCHGGHKMVVYLVLLPKDKDPKWSQRDRDIVVVDHIEHELPIGVLTYQDVNHDVVQNSQQVRVQQVAYKNHAVELEHKAEEERKLCHLKEAERLEQECEEAWQQYHEMREDELRNIHLSRYIEPTTLLVDPQ